MNPEKNCRKCKLIEKRKQIMYCKKYMNPVFNFKYAKYCNYYADVLIEAEAEQKAGEEG